MCFQQYFLYRHWCWRAVVNLLFSPSACATAINSRCSEDSRMTQWFKTVTVWPQLISGTKHTCNTSSSNLAVIITKHLFIDAHHCISVFHLFAKHSWTACCSWLCCTLLWSWQSSVQEDALLHTPHNLRLNQKSELMVSLLLKHVKLRSFFDTFDRPSVVHPTSFTLIDGRHSKNLNSNS